MLPLAELQARFAAHLLAPPGPDAPAELAAVVAPGGAPAGERLAVYKNNVYSTLIDALAAAFPAVARLVGADFFRYAAQVFVARRPPRSAVLADYGDAFPGFLARFAPAASVPYLADVARLEQLYLEAYHAAEAAPVSAERFAAALADPHAPAIALHPSARLMRSDDPVSRIWELNRRPDFPEGKTRIPREAERLLVIRPRTTVEVRRLGPGAHAALSALAGGSSPAGALAAGAAAEPGADVERHLTSLAAGETLVLR
jgi:hypothetical protein